jgi:hypothetical protein
MDPRYCYVNGTLDDCWAVGDLSRREVRCPGCGRDNLRPRRSGQRPDGTVWIVLPRHHTKRALEARNEAP